MNDWTVPASCAELVPDGLLPVWPQSWPNVRWWAIDAMPDQLSEGARKLVGVARGLAGHPRLLCLDEPAAGLDARESEELGRALRELADGGQSTLLIDHDMGLVLSICDRVVVLEFGRVIAERTTRDRAPRRARDRRLSRRRRRRAS